MALTLGDSARNTVPERGQRREDEPREIEKVRMNEVETCSEPLEYGPTSRDRVFQQDVNSEVYLDMSEK